MSIWLAECGGPIGTDNKLQLEIPPGFAYGFVVTSESAEFLYKTTDYWHPKYEQSILWSDSFLDIKWPITSDFNTTSRMLLA